MPITPDTAADALAQWIFTNEPELFNALLAKTPQSVHGVSDILSNVAGGITSAAKNVGSFLTSQEGMTALSSLGSIYLQTQMQRDALKIQVAQAQQGKPPAPIQTQPNPMTGTTSAYYYPQGQAPVPLTPNLANQLLPPRNYTPWLIGGAAFLVVTLLLVRR